GQSIRAAKANSGNGYVTYSGTSMATPFVAGVAALMLDAAPGLTPASLKSMILSTAQDWRTTGADSDTGAGRLQAYQAIERAGSFTGTPPVVPSHWMEGSRALGATGSEDGWALPVTSISAPIAITLIIPSASSSKDFDLYLETAGTTIASSETTTR